MSFLSRRDTLLALLVVFIWGLHFAVIKAGVAQIGPFLSLSLRFGATALIFLPFMRKTSRAVFFKMAEVGILMGVLHQGLLFFAIRELDSASVAVLMQSQSIFAVLLGWLLLGEGFRWRTTLGLALSGVGLVIMMGVPDIAAHPRGFAIVIASAVVLALSYIRMRQLAQVHAPTFLAVINLVSFPFALAGALVSVGPAQIPVVLAAADWRVVGAVVAYQALLVSFSHSLWQKLLSRNEVARVTSFTLLSPVFAIALGVLFLGTPATPELFLGAGLILAGLGVVVLRRVQLHRNDPIALGD